MHGAISFLLHGEKNQLVSQLSSGSPVVSLIPEGTGPSKSARRTQFKKNSMRTRYLPAVNVHDPSISAAIYSGALRLQCGQWLQTGDKNLSRFVKFTGASIWAAHWDGSKKARAERFRQLVSIVNTSRPRR